jgi:hypothetical protein
MRKHQLFKLCSFTADLNANIAPNDLFNFFSPASYTEKNLTGQQKCYFLKQSSVKSRSGELFPSHHTAFGGTVSRKSQVG